VLREASWFVTRVRCRGVGRGLGVGHEILL
jgi:hypothetical protein